MINYNYHIISYYTNNTVEEEGGGEFEKCFIESFLFSSLYTRTDGSGRSLGGGKEKKDGTFSTLWLGAPDRV